MKEEDYPKDIIEKLFFEFDKGELIILKAHLLIEYALNQFIQTCNLSNSDFEKMNFTFSNKIKIATLFGLFNSNDDLLNYITDLNRLRNQVAHKHEFDETLYEKIVNYPEGFKGQNKWKTKEEYCEGMMAIKSSFMCGYITSKKQKSG